MSEEINVVVLNNELFFLENKEFNRIQPKLKEGNISVWDEKQQAIKHSNRCALIRKYGKKIFNIDLILRDD